MFLNGVKLEWQSFISLSRGALGVIEGLLKNNPKGIFSPGIDRVTILFTANIIAYPTTSHGIWRSNTEMIISHEVKLSGIYETEVWDKSHIPWLVVG